MKYFFVGVLLLLTVILRAAPVTVRGVSTLPAQPVRAIQQADMISGLDRIVGQSKTDFKGSFELRFELDDIQMVEIAIGLSRATFVAVPGAVYDIQFTMSKAIRLSYFDAQPLQMKVVKATDGGVHEQIERINIIYNAFVMEHFNALYRLGRVALLDSLNITLDKALTKAPHPFVQKYRDYKLASLAPLVRKLDLRRVYEINFKGKDILYLNPEYMSLFKEFFSAILVNNRTVSFDQFIRAVGEGYAATDQLLQKDPLLSENRQFRELGMLKLLRDHYFHPAFGPNTVNKLLKSIAATSPYSQHQQIAANIISKQDHLAFNSAAPAFELIDYEGKKWSQKTDRKGALIVFVREDCKVCDKELMEIRALHEKQKEFFQFITISTKEGFEYYRRFFATNRIDWPLLNLGEQLFLLEDYNIKVFPDYVLLLPDGRVAMAPAPSVDRNLEHHMNRLKRNF